MFSLRRRALGRRSPGRLALLGIVSFAGLLAIISSLDVTHAWLPAISPAHAQSETAPPTLVPPDPTAGSSEPPLVLQSWASVVSAVAGEQFSFTTTVAAASAEPRAVELRVNIDGQLELVSASGACSGGGALACKLSVQRGRPATIVATVRVRPNAAPGGRLIYQALAQDDLSNTAASDQVVVKIEPAPAAPTTPPKPAEPPPRPTLAPDAPVNSAGAPERPAVSSNQPAASAPTAGPTNPAPTIVPTPIAMALPVVPVAILRSPAGAAAIAVPAGEAVSADSWLDMVPSVPAVQAPDAGVPAPVAPEQPALPRAEPAPALDAGAPALVAPEQPALPLAEPAPVVVPVAIERRQLVQLPNTAAAPPMVGYVALLLGLALTVHGLRRVRHAAAQLDQQGAALGRLAQLAGSQARRRASIGDRLSDVREENHGSADHNSS